MTDHKKIADFLRRIPQSNQPAYWLTDLVESPEDRAMLLGCVLLLQALGVVRYEDDRVRASSQTAKYTLMSLASFLETETRIIEDWHTRGLMPQSEGNALQNGASFLAVLESRRLEALADATTPARTERVAQVIIKRNNPETGDDEFLFQYDANARQYQLIGGRWREADGADLLVTIIREIEEELPKNDLRYQQTYNLRLLAENMTLPLRLSPTFGAITQYTFSIYLMTGLKSPLVLSSGDCWINLSAIREGFVFDEMRNQRVAISMTDIYRSIEVLTGQFETLPSSFA